MGGLVEGSKIPRPLRQSSLPPPSRKDPQGPHPQERGGCRLGKQSPGGLLSPPSAGLPRRRRRLGGRGSSTRHPLPLLGSRAIGLEVGSGPPKAAPAGRRGYAAGAAAGARTVVGRVGRGDAAHQLAQPLHVPLPKRKSQAQPLGGGHAAQGGPPVGDPRGRRRRSRAGSPGSSAGAGRNAKPAAPPGFTLELLAHRKGWSGSGAGAAAALERRKAGERSSSSSSSGGRGKWRRLDGAGRGGGGGSRQARTTGRPLRPPPSDPPLPTAADRAIPTESAPSQALAVT